MKLYCAVCGRATKPYAVIGSESIGPKCARKIGLSKRKASKGVMFPERRPGPFDDKQMKLFDL